MTNYHVNPETLEVGKCGAKIKCAFQLSIEKHYPNRASAIAAVDKAQSNKTFKTMSKKATNKGVLIETKLVKLDSSMGEIEVKDGDLSDKNARISFTTGLCGDLAIAIHKLNNAKIYFVCDESISQDDFDNDVAEDPEYLFDFASHVVVASAIDGKFLDADGQHSKDEIIAFYKETGSKVHILEGNADLARHYSLNGDPDLYKKFAETAITMDKDGVSYEKVAGYL